MLEKNHLLQTKLHRPRLRRKLVHRSRLLEKLDKSPNRPLTIVCAPAGFGKTTLVSEWIERMEGGQTPGSVRLPAAWLSLEPGDNDITILMSYLIAALRSIFKDACGETFNLVHAASPPPLSTLTISLCNEIEQLPTGFILVLDDYHAVQQQAVSELINGLVQHRPGPLHLVLISRYAPSLSLARLRANDQLVEIRSRDLRFGVEETARFLDQELEAPLSENVVEKIDYRLEGWIGALRLVILSHRSPAAIESFLSTAVDSDEALADYLMDEVLSQQVPAIQSFLLKTSILDRFCVPLCEAVIGDGDPAWTVSACVDALERSELFIIPLDDRKQWYRFHHLVRDLLRKKLSDEKSPDQINQLHLGASAWLKQQGLIEEALQQALQANALEAAAAIMIEGLPDLLNCEDRRTLERWQNLLPEEFVQRQPWLLMIRLWARGFSWQPKLIKKLYQQIETLLDEKAGVQQSAESLALLRGQLAVEKAQEAYFQNQPALAITLCREALALLPRSWTYLRGAAMLYLGMCMQIAAKARLPSASCSTNTSSWRIKPTAMLCACCFPWA